MNKEIKIKVIVGSTRRGRFGDKPARWIFDIIKKYEGVDAEILDLRDYPMPFFDEMDSPSSVKGEYPNPIVNAWAQKIADADAFIVVSPEYNHGYSAVLKNAFDYIYKEWNNKPVGMVSYGGLGGARAIEQIHQVAVALQMAPIGSSVNILAPWNLLEADGSLKSGALEPYEKNAQNLITQLLLWARALQVLRNNTD